MTILEVTVSISLIAVVLLAVVEVIPTAFLGTRRSHDVEAATAYEAYLLDDARLHPTSLVTMVSGGLQPVTYTVNVKLGESDLQMVRQPILNSNPAVIDVVVTATGPRPPPIVLSTRVLYDPTQQ